MQKKINNKIYVIILASGIGKRIRHHSLPKQFLKLAGKTVIEHTIEAFEKNKLVDEIIIVNHPNYRNYLENIISRRKFLKISKILNGGKTRTESSYIGTSSISGKDGIALIHDAVRPFVSQSIINNCIRDAKKYGAVDVAIPSADTLIKVTDKQTIERVPDRSRYMRGQTPQAFRLNIINKAHQNALRDNYYSTDDCSLVLKYGLSEVSIVAGEKQNIKITYAEDIFLADKIFQMKKMQLPRGVRLKYLNNKVIVVFGGSRGIGKAICDLGRRYGAIVKSYSRDNGCDIRSFSNINTALKCIHQQEGNIDFVINTAGILKMGTLVSRTQNDIMEEIKINYLGSVNVVKASTPYLKKTKGGILLFTSSSFTRGRALYSIYSSTKAAIVNFMQAQADELSMIDIKINAINPERTDTEMRIQNFGYELKSELLKPSVVAKISLQTLLSDYTGQVIDIRK